MKKKIINKVTFSFSEIPDGGVQIAVDISTAMAVCTPVLCRDRQLKTKMRTTHIACLGYELYVFARVKVAFSLHELPSAACCPATGFCREYRYHVE